MDRFEDWKDAEFDSISLDNVSWNPFTLSLMNEESSDESKNLGAGGVEQDLYFGRTKGSLPQEE